MTKTIISKTFTPLVDGEGNKDMVVRIATGSDLIQEGIIKRIGIRGYCVFTVLVSYMNKNYHSFPSMTKIGQLTGMSRQTVSKGVKDLEELGIIEKVITDRRNEYKLNYTENLTNDTVVIDTQEEEPEDVAPEIVFTSAKDVAFYFAKQYEKQYGHRYVINYGRDLSLIKNKLRKAYSDDELRLVIDTAIEQYREQWANDKYAYPTIPMLATWLGNQAMAFTKQKQENVEKLYDNIKQSEEEDETDIALDIF